MYKTVVSQLIKTMTSLLTMTFSFIGSPSHSVQFQFTSLTTNDDHRNY